MNDPRSEYWQRILADRERLSTVEGEAPSELFDATDLDVAIAVIDGGPGTSAAILFRTHDGRHVFLERFYNSDGVAISESGVIGPRDKCELNIPPETRKRLGLRGELRRTP